MTDEQLWKALLAAMRRGWAAGTLDFSEMTKDALQKAGKSTDPRDYFPENEGTGKSEATGSEALEGTGNVGAGRHHSQ